LNEKLFQELLEKIKLIQSELQEDLSGLPLNKYGLKVGDFGCGAGYTTWSFLLSLSKSECIGVDKFLPFDIPPEWETLLSKWDIESDFQRWNIESVQSHNKDIVDYIKSGTFEVQGDALLQGLCSAVVKDERQPAIQRGDIVSGEGLFPDFRNYFDFVYCKRLLFPIFNGEYENQKNDITLRLAIANIANTLKNGGWFCFVEVAYLKESSSLEEILKGAGFQFKSPRNVVRPYKTLEKIYPQYDYHIYHCKKMDVEDVNAS